MKMSEVEVQAEPQNPGAISHHVMHSEIQASLFNDVNSLPRTYAEAFQPLCMSN